jgi:hypothetical protein
MFCPSVDEWMNKMWPMYTAEYYSALKRNENLTHTITWMKTEDVLNEMKPDTKGQFCTISLR